MTPPMPVSPLVVACVRPLLTWVVVTLPRWWQTWVHRPPAPQVLPPSWIAKHLYDVGTRGDHP